MSLISQTKLILIILLFSLVISDSEKVLKPLKLEDKIKGKMDENESREYFELKLPENIKRGVFPGR